MWRTQRTILSALEVIYTVGKLQSMSIAWSFHYGKKQINLQKLPKTCYSVISLLSQTWPYSSYKGSDCNWWQCWYNKTWRISLDHWNFFNQISSEYECKARLSSFLYLYLSEFHKKIYRYKLYWLKSIKDIYGFS